MHAQRGGGVASSLCLPELGGPTFHSGVLLWQTGKRPSAGASTAVPNELCLSSGFPFPQLSYPEEKGREECDGRA
jgi:hypothetical protein